MSRFLLLLILLISSNLSILAQNLIYNHGFEENKECYKNVNQTGIKEICNNWYSIGTPDYYSKCSRSRKTSIPNNTMGKQLPKEGEAYIGLILGTGFTECVSEAVQGRLKEKLQKDSSYCISFYYSLAEGSNYYSDEISVVLHNSKFNYKDKVIDIKSKNVLTETIKHPENFENWQFFCKKYKSKGNESFLTIGNFSCAEKSNINEWKNKPIKFSGYFKREAYYFIDAVNIHKINNKEDCHCGDSGTQTKDSLVETPTFDLNQTITLPDFTFKTKQWQLENVENSLLDSLADYLLINKNYNITISGHTDNVGKEVDNVELSEKRAETIRQYLLSKGVEKTRMTIKGYGSTKPVESNVTEEGRAKNRRVEIQIVNENE